MKNMKKRFWTALAALFCGALAAGCGNNDPAPAKKTALSSVSAVSQTISKDKRGGSPDNPVPLTVKINAAELPQLFEAIAHEDKYVALDLSQCPGARYYFSFSLGDLRLVSISLPDGFVIISNHTFRGSASLASVTLPKSIGGIWYSAFEDCTSLRLVICHAEEPPELRDAFANTWPSAIKVPAGSVGAYLAAEGWRAFADRISEI